MAKPTNMDEPHEQPRYKTWVLKVSIHCEGCRRKVQKVLSSVHGVHSFDVDLKLQRVVVTGSVDIDTLIYKLAKSGRKAELWAEISNPNNNKYAKDKNREKDCDIHDSVASTSSGQGEKEKQESGKVVNPTTAECSDVGTAKVDKTEVTTACAASSKVNQVEGTLAGIVTTKDSQAGALAASNPAIKANQAETFAAGIPTNKVNQAGALAAGIPTNKVNQAGASAAGIPTSKVNQAGALAAGIPTNKVNQAGATTRVKVNQEEATKVSSGGEVDASKEKKVNAIGNKPEMGSTSMERSVGKKKKKKGQNSNTTTGAQVDSQSEEASLNAWTGPHEKNSLTPPTANNIPPRQLENQYPPTNYYYPPTGPPPPPVHVMSYNMAHPTPNYTTSYYASSPATTTPYPSSYASPATTTPYPSSYYSYNRYQEPPQTAEQQQQQFDSLFSDENPNGCSVM